MPSFQTGLAFRYPGPVPADTREKPSVKTIVERPQQKVVAPIHSRRLEDIRPAEEKDLLPPIIMDLLCGIALGACYCLDASIFNPKVCKHVGAAAGASAATLALVAAKIFKLNTFQTVALTIVAVVYSSNFVMENITTDLIGRGLGNINDAGASALFAGVVIYGRGVDSSLTGAFLGLGVLSRIGGVALGTLVGPIAGAVTGGLLHRNIKRLLAQLV